MTTDKQKQIYDALGFVWNDENSDLGSWEGFGLLFEKMKARPDFMEFLFEINIEWKSLINPERFAEAVWQYLYGEKDVKA